MVCPKPCHDEQSYNDHLLGLESSWDVDIAKNSVKGLITPGMRRSSKILS